MIRWLLTMLSSECITCGQPKPKFCSFCDDCFARLGWCDDASDQIVKQTRRISEIDERP